jgi:hypothetical protein
MPDHERQRDSVANRRLLRAALLFAAAMLGVGASIVWSLATTQGKEAGDVQSLTVCCFILLVGAASVYVFYAMARLKWIYRCPRCGDRLPRVPKTEAGSRIRYRCERCRVDWDTGWNEARRSY